jgi:hypothetical protein
MKTSMALLAALLISGLMAPAQASHPTSQCINLEPDPAYPTYSYATDYLSATYGLSDDNHPPDQACHTGDAGVAGQDLNIDFEISGVADPDSSDTPETPDLTCTIAADEQSCSVIPPESGGGDQFIRGWVDIDLDDSTVEADPAEGQDETSEPGESEPDFTDVALWRWIHGDGRRVSTTLTLHYDSGRRRFFGVVESRYARCRSSRRINLVKASTGTRRWIRQTKSQADDRWQITMHRDPRGSFRAKAERKVFTRRNGDTVVCNAGTSRKRDVP